MVNLQPERAMAPGTAPIVILQSLHAVDLIDLLDQELERKIINSVGRVRNERAVSVIGSIAHLR
jgi:hypothetical protein